MENSVGGYIIIQISMYTLCSIIFHLKVIVVHRVPIPNMFKFTVVVYI